MGIFSNHHFVISNWANTFRISFKISSRPIHYFNPIIWLFLTILLNKIFQKESFRNNFPKYFLVWDWIFYPYDKDWGTIFYLKLNYVKNPIFPNSFLTLLFQKTSRLNWISDCLLRYYRLLLIFALLQYTIH